MNKDNEVIKKLVNCPIYITVCDSKTTKPLDDVYVSIFVNNGIGHKSSDNISTFLNKQGIIHITDFGPAKFYFNRIPKSIEFIVRKKGYKTKFLSNFNFNNNKSSFIIYI